MRQRLSLYLCVDGVEPNRLPESDPGSAQWLWRDLTSSSGSARVPIKTTPIRVSDFMGFDVTETSFIPLRGCRRAKRPPAIRSRIGPAVVEESPIEFRDLPQPTLFRINWLAVVECCSCGPGLWMLSVVMKRVSGCVQFEVKCRETTRY